jgi:hypothetical protein
MAKRRKDPAAVSLGRKGGKARAKKLSKEELSAQGRTAIQARWARHKGAGSKSS